MVEAKYSTVGTGFFNNDYLCQTGKRQRDQGLVYRRLGGWYFEPEPGEYPSWCRWNKSKRTDTRRQL